MKRRTFLKGSVGGIGAWAGLCVGGGGMEVEMVSASAEQQSGAARDSYHLNYAQKAGWTGGRTDPLATTSVTAARR